MNRSEFTAAVAEKIGDKKAAQAAVDAMLETIQDAVTRGEKVAFTGWGSFERIVRPARDARNPATGQTIRIPETAVPRFKAGAAFKNAVAEQHRA